MTGTLELRGVWAGYGRIQILRGLSLVVPEGSVVALLGPNGVGKTTTLRAIAGLATVTDGSIVLDGRRLDGRRPSAIASSGVVLVPEGRGVFPSLTVEENLRIAHHSAPAHAAGPWPEWLDQISTVFPKLGERLGQVAGSLSGGEQQMLAVSRSLVGDPKVVMFDELSMGLAPLVVAELFDRVAALRDAGHTVLLVEQYLTYALELADLVYILAKGQIAWQGDPGELRHSDEAAALLGPG